MSHDHHTPRVRGYCLVFARNTDQWFTEIQGRKLVSVRNEEYKGATRILCAKYNKPLDLEDDENLLAKLEKNGLCYAIAPYTDVLR